MWHFVSPRPALQFQKSGTLVPCDGSSVLTLACPAIFSGTLAHHKAISCNLAPSANMTATSTIALVKEEKTMGIH